MGFCAHTKPCLLYTSRNIQAVREYQACVAGMPVKDTIKISDEEEFAAATPDRSKLWMIQTPQTFSYELIYQAYRVLITSEDVYKRQIVTMVTWGDLDATYSAIYLVLAALFVGYSPLSLWCHAKMLLQRSEALRNTQHFTVDEKGVTISQDGEEALLELSLIHILCSSFYVLNIQIKTYHGLMPIRHQPQ